MKVLTMEQGSPEWLAARAGKVTASRINDVMAAKTTAAYRDYRAQIVAEILTGQPQESGFTNAAMQWGTDKEPLARAEYEMFCAWDVEEVGLVLHPTIERGAASPDGLVSTDGLVEIKCPKTSTHLQTLVDKKQPRQYENQMLWQMACTGRQWCDFVSYDPRLPEDLQLFVHRFDRDQERIDAIEEAVRQFLTEVNEIIDKIKEKK
jgi:putative phage-type endonuclease